MINYGIHIGKSFISITILLILSDGCFILNELPIAAAADAPQSVVRIDEQRLVGRWVRPDGGYTLKLKEVGKEGNVKAAYFNPRPINVAKAEFSRKEGKLTIFIELRDVNYPGSQYNLQYDAKTDRLIGTYFQAVEKQTYSIEFMRTK
jgi:hypothetical protein